MAEDISLILRLLKLVSLWDCNDSIWWKDDYPRGTDSGPSELQFFVHCNDIFCWGCSDCEEISNHADLDQLEAAMNDASKPGKNFFGEPNIDYDSDGMLLYVARRRQSRPQGAVYKHIDERLWPLFDACGPEREPGLGNPVAHPARPTTSASEPSPLPPAPAQ